MQVLEGFSLTDEIQSAVGELPGAATFSAVWYGFYGGPIEGAGQFLMGAVDGIGGGWSLSAGGQSGTGQVGFEAAVYDAAPTLITSAAQAEPIVQGMRPKHIAVTFDGTNLTPYVDGVRGPFVSVAGAPGFTAQPTARFRVGVGGIFGDEPATQCGFVGAGYIGSVLTPAELQEHLQACRDANNAFVAGSIAWLNRYDVQNPGGGFPLTIADLAGAADLTVVGSLTLRTRNLL